MENLNNDMLNYTFEMDENIDWDMFEYGYDEPTKINKDMLKYETLKKDKLVDKFIDLTLKNGEEEKTEEQKRKEHLKNILTVHF